MLQSWATIIIDKIGVKHPRMINADLAFKAAKRKEDIYVYAAYFKPGK
jgi:glutamine amidotransferase-like uncharacterized protein